MRLIFLGPPGAGKGTQAKVIAKKYGMVHISTGDILREAIKNNTSVGIQAKAYMDKGELVPDDVVIKIVIDRLASPDVSGGFILDGFPRTKVQAISLDKELAKIKLNIDSVIYFKTSEQMSIDRLSGRRVCRACGANYHIKTMKPKRDGVCDSCDGNLYQRDDDKVETIKNRLQVYQKLTADLIDYYDSKGSLMTVSGDLSIEEVLKELSGFFDKK